MSASDLTVFGTLEQALGVPYSSAGGSVWLEFNTENHRVIDDEGIERIGAGAATLDTDGALLVSGVPAPGTSNPVSFQCKIHYDVRAVLPARRGVMRERGDFGWMTITGTTRTVTNKALTSNVATITVSEAHGLKVGHTVAVAGVDATFNITAAPITAVTSTTVSYAVTHANVTSAAASGTLTSKYANLALLEDEQAVPAEYLTTVTDLLDGYVTAAAGSATDAATSATDAADSATDAETARDAAIAAGLVWQGAWSAPTAYAVADAVSYSGSSYRRLIAGTTAGTPAADTTNWGLLSAKGDTGATGAAGGTDAATASWITTGPLTGAALGNVPAKLLTSAGGGSRLWSDTFARGNRSIVGDTAPSGVAYTQHGSFNTQNFAPKIVSGRYVIDPAAANWAGWSFALMPHTSDYDVIGAEFGYKVSVLGSPTNTQECVLVASAVKPTLSNLSVQFATSPTGYHLFKIMGGARVQVGGIGFLSSTLSTGGAITALPVTGGTFGGTTRGITQPVPSGSTITLVSNDELHSQTWTTTADAAIGDTSIAVASQTPNFAYSSVAPVATVILGTHVSGVGTHATPLVQDDSTRHQATMRLDRATSTVTCTVNGQTVGSWTDPDFVAFWGRQAALQLLRGTTTGDVWATSVTTLGPPPPPALPNTPANVPYMTGDTATYFNTPAPAWPVATTGGLSVVAEVTPDLWQSGATQVIASQWATNDFSWWFGTPASGGKKLNVGLSVDGVTTVNVVSSTVHTLTDAVIGLVGAAYDPATGLVTFYTSTTLANADKKLDNSDGGTWTQLGTAVASGVTGALWQSSKTLRVGNRNTTSTLPFTGYLYYVRIKDAIGGTMLGSIDFRTAWSGTDAVGNKWSANGSGISYRAAESSVIGLVTDLAALNASVAALSAVPTYKSIDTTVRSANNTTSDTVLNTFTTVAAGSLAVGQVYELVLDGSLDTIASGGVFTLKVKVGSTVLTVSTALTVSRTAGSTLAWRARFSLYIETTGAGGVLSCVGSAETWSGAATTTAVPLSKSDLAHSVDLSSGLALTTVASMATADSGNTLRINRARFVQVA